MNLKWTCSNCGHKWLGDTSEWARCEKCHFDRHRSWSIYPNDICSNCGELFNLNNISDIYEAAEKKLVYSPERNHEVYFSKYLCQNCLDKKITLVSTKRNIIYILAIIGSIIFFIFGIMQQIRNSFFFLPSYIFGTYIFCFLISKVFLKPTNSFMTNLFAIFWALVIAGIYSVVNFVLFVIIILLICCLPDFFVIYVLIFCSILWTIVSIWYFRRTL